MFGFLCIETKPLEKSEGISLWLGQENPVERPFLKIQVHVRSWF